jgi:hypothetical protein
MTRILPLLCLIVATGCAKSGSTEPPAPSGKLSDFAKEVLMTMEELKVQPGARPFIDDIDKDAALQDALARGLDPEAKEKFQKLVDKHGKNESFRKAVIAAGGDPAACGEPKPEESDPGCAKAEAGNGGDLLAPAPPKNSAPNLLDP